MRSLENKVVVITGGSRGIGAAIAREFADRKAKLVLCGRDRGALEATGKALGVPDGDLLLLTADVSKPDGMAGIVENAWARFGRIDVFVNNAGVGGFKPLVEMTDDEFDYIYEVNVRAVFRSLKALLPRFREQGGGQVICISSMSSKAGGANMAAYASSKAALNVLCESVAAEVRNDNIKISVVAPGSVDTGFGGVHAPRSSDKAKTRLTAEEVAEAVVYLAQQDENAWVSYAEMRTLRVKK